MTNNQSKIEKLIAELCPYGVEYCSINSFAHIRHGKDYKNLGIGGIPVYGSGGIMTYVDTFSYNKPTVLIPRKGSITNLYYVDEPFWNVDTIFYTEIDTNIINTKYFYYSMKNINLALLDTGSGRPSLTIQILNRITIPVPPMKVQEEIVSILDKFTQLEAELEAELEVRKKQYEHYKENLLTFRDEIKRVPLRDICDIGDGLHGTPKYNESGEYYFINGNNLKDCQILFDSKTKKVDNEMYKKHGILFFENKTIFMSINGTIGSVSLFNNEKIVLGKSVSYFNPKSDLLDSKFLYYFLQTNFAKNYFVMQKTGSTINNLGLKALREFKIPLPLISEQLRLVLLLDKFEALVNDISVGLPAELAARRKQYEHYANILLTFKERR